MIRRCTRCNGNVLPDGDLKTCILCGQSYDDAPSLAERIRADLAARPSVYEKPRRGRPPKVAGGAS